MPLLLAIKGVNEAYVSAIAQEMEDVNLAVKSVLHFNKVPANSIKRTFAP